MPTARSAYIIRSKKRNIRERREASQDFYKFKTFISTPSTFASAFVMPANGRLAIKCDIDITAGSIRLITNRGRTIKTSAFTKGRIFYLPPMERGVSFTVQNDLSANITFYILDRWDRLFRVGNLAGAFTRDSYKLADGTYPSVLMDFIAGIYYSGSSAVAANTLLNGTLTIDAFGLVMPGDNSVTAKGALATAFSATQATVAGVVDKGRQNKAQFPLTMGSDNNSPIYFEGTTQPQASINYTGHGALSQKFPASDWTAPNYFSAAWHASVPPLRVGAYNDNTPFQDNNFYDAFSPVVLGDLNGGSGGADNFTGRYQRIAIYPNRLTAAQIAEIRTLAPFAVRPRTGLYAPDASSTVLGTNVLKFERTQAWSAEANYAVANIDTSAGQVLFSNVINSPWCGWEIWITGTVDGGAGRPSGRVCVRIMQDLNGNSGPASAIDLYGNVSTDDGLAHYIFVEYDGSSTAAGVKIWVDGVLNTKTVIQDNLAGSILGNAGLMFIGNQNGAGASGNFGGLLINHLAISNLVRGDTYAAAGSSYATKHALDSNHVLYFDYTDGVGNIVRDRTTNHNDGRIIGSAASWYGAQGVTNLITTQDLSDTFWSKSGYTVTGTDTLNETATTAIHTVAANGGVALTRAAGVSTYHVSGMFKPVGAIQYLNVGVFSTGFAAGATVYADLSAGTTNSNGGYGGWSIANIVVGPADSSGYIPVSFDATTDGTTTGLIFDLQGNMPEGTYTFLGDVTKGFKTLKLALIKIA